MQDTDVFVKTDAGRDEIKSRARGLSMAMRAILLMVDGQRSVAALRSVIAGSKAPADTLDVLVAQRLIESRTAAAGGTVASAAGSAPVSISTPRIATMTRPPAPAPEPPPAARSDAELLDLMLPTIYGSEEWSASTPVGTPPAAAETPARSPKDRYEHLYTMINEVVRDFLPAHRRYMIQLKIERAGTPEELVDLLDTVQAALVKAKGEEFAAGVVARLRSAAA